MTVDCSDREIKRQGRTLRAVIEKCIVWAMKTSASRENMALLGFLQTHLPSKTCLRKRIQMEVAVVYTTNPTQDQASQHEHGRNSRGPTPS